jgi:SAM-dependent methyltransferase
MRWTLTRSHQQRRLRPYPWQGNYVVLRPLARQLEEEARKRLRPGSDVIDVGCGLRPYEPIFAPYAKRYVGVDVLQRGKTDVIAPAESLPFDDATFDCLLCTQLLEHSPDPAAVCSEASRVLRPGGVAFISTHGVAQYHAQPIDHWRWTHTGLELQLTRAGSWSEIRVRPNGGTAYAFAYLIGKELEILLGRGAFPFVLPLNGAAIVLNSLMRRVRPSVTPKLVANYLVVAVRAQP